ncbi:Uncharacterized membrane protein [Anaerobranca californiensis DSM 14826]|jgi:uncharacterized membrane protein|uniref:Uncharacterized membrane protein n=1 Tax=Anaerobranca californiensis DSM 14826 TaxID=1120989 RepID=A0A1M6LFH6_9FIRM|nr:DUF1622 domain-containing protein [Anaerobranca californiensis]SHJ69947.1 Uncharacterized membrane protein [Anaerobranca californiensis DSM 14826]
MHALYEVLHHLALDLTMLLILLLEILGAGVIIYVGIVSLFKFLSLKFCQTSTEIRIRFGRGIAMGLQFYLAAEILRLITIREYKDLAIVGAIIILHVIVSVLVSWEVHHSIKMIKEEEELDKKSGLFPKYNKNQKCDM